MAALRCPELAPLSERRSISRVIGRMGDYTISKKRVTPAAEPRAQLAKKELVLELEFEERVKPAGFRRGSERPARGSFRVRNLACESIGLRSTRLELGQRTSVRFQYSPEPPGRPRLHDSPRRESYRLEGWASEELGGARTVEY